MTGTITPDTIEEARTEIGLERRVMPWNTVATPDAIRHYLLGVGDDDPRWWGEGALPSFAPDGFLYSCVDGPIVPGAIDDQPGADTWFAGAAGLWASDRWRWLMGVPTGAEVKVATCLWAVEERERRDAPLAVRQTTRTTFGSHEGDTFAELFRTILRFDAQPGPVGAEIPISVYDDAELDQFRAHHRGEPVAGAGEPSPLSMWAGAPIPRLLKGPLTVTSLIGWLLGVGSPLNQTNRVLTKLLDVNPGAALVHPATGVADTIEATHWDSDLARRVGFPRGYDFGGQRIAWAIHLLSDWRAGRGRLAELDAKLLRPNLLGDVQWMEGEIVAVEGTDLIDVTCDVRARNQRDEITMAARALIVGVDAHEVIR